MIKVMQNEGNLPYKSTRFSNTLLLLHQKFCHDLLTILRCHSGIFAPAIPEIIGYLC